MSSKSLNLVECQRRPDIKFFKSGKIDIMANVTKMLDLKEGDVINILDSGFGEYYLYPSIRRDKYRIPNANLRNSVHPTKERSRNYRCWSRELVSIVSNLTGADTSWLFVGVPKDLSSFGIGEKGLPLIYRNNQYKPIPMPEP